MPMSDEVLRVCPAAHPALAGHFPGNPIVPGVVLLEEVFLAAVAAFGDIELAGFPAVKFLGLLRPDEPFAVRLIRNGRDPGQDRAEISFVCTSGGRTISRGRMAVRDRRSPRSAEHGAASGTGPADTFPG